MAAFTSLLVGAALAGGLFAGKKVAQAQAKGASASATSSSSSTTAPGPDASLAAPAPPNAVAAASNAAQAGQAAGLKVRKKAQIGLNQNTGIVGPRSSIAAPVSTAAPRSLSGY